MKSLRPKTIDKIQGHVEVINNHLSGLRDTLELLKQEAHRLYLLTGEVSVSSVGGHVPDDSDLNVDDLTSLTEVAKERIADFQNLIKQYGDM